VRRREGSREGEVIPRGLYSKFDAIRWKTVTVTVFTPTKRENWKTLILNKNKKKRKSQRQSAC